MRKLLLPFVAVLAAAMMGCETNPPSSPTEQAAIRDDAKVTLDKMQAQDANLAGLLKNSYGYAIFPEVGAAAVGIGGASGVGEVYKGGQRIGQITLNQASIGVQLGGETFAELVVFQDEHAFNRIVNNSVEFGADANAIILKAGAAGSANFSNGVAVFVMPRGGLMAGVNVNGQKFIFQPQQDQSNH